MKRPFVQIVLGALIVVAGTLLLMETIRSVSVSPIVWAALLAIGGGVFWYVFAADVGSWWAAIPASALVGAVVVQLFELDPGGLGQWTEVPILAAISAGFWAVFFRDRQRWWAVIPAGMLLTLSVLTLIAPTVSGPVAGATFLFGAAATFALVGLVPGGRHRWWAWFPTAACAIAAALVLVGATGWLVVLDVVGPVLVVAAGAWLLWRAVARSRADRAPTASPAGGTVDPPAASGDAEGTR